MKYESFPLVSDGGKMKNKNPILFVPLFFCFLLFLYGPVETYVLNQNDFSFDIFDLLKIMIPVFVLAFFLCLGIFLLAARRTEKIAGILSAAFTAAAVAMYIQGTFFSGFLPELNGENIDWDIFNLHRIDSVVLWSAFFLLAFFLVLKKDVKTTQSITNGISAAGTALLSLTMCLNMFSGNALDNKENLIVSGNGMLDMSTENNIVVLLLDMLGEPEFTDYLERFPAQAEVFEDFTHFNNAVGGYKYTICSIPYIFSGDWYLYQSDFEEYKNEAFKNSEVLSYLYSSGYSLGMYDTDVALTTDSAERFINVHEPGVDRFKTPYKFILMQIELTGLRYFPFDMKKYCVLTPQNIAADSEKGTEGEDVFEEQSGYLYSHLKRSGLSLSENSPAFRYIHVQGAHPPFLYDSDYNKKEDVSYDEMYGSCITLIRELINQMKNLGIYDCSSIVIMADHGRNDSRQNPILYIKGRNERHPMKENAAPVAWGDLQKAIARLADGEKSDNLFDYKEGDYRERLYYSYDVFGNDPIIEYIQYGNAGDLESLRPTGKVFKKNQ